MTDKYEKWIEFTTCGAGIALCLRGEHGATQFKLLRVLAEASQGVRRMGPRFALARWRFQRSWGRELENAKRPIGTSHPVGLDPPGETHCHPQLVDLGYHSYTPVHKDHEPITNSCSVLHGRPCYYDGSEMGAQRAFDVLLKEGNEGVWRELEEYYQRTFQHLEERACD